ncbi:MAG: formylglycine-generating enzyme family protein [Nannocystales bacterium]
MHRLVFVLSALALVTSCARTPEPAPVEPEAESSVAAPVSPAPAEAVPDPEPEREPEPEPAPAPPPVPSLSDGTTIAGCDASVANMACVPGGSFIVGSDDGPENARPAHPVELQTFYMDLFEVTYKEYKDCFKSGKCPKGGPFYMDFNRKHQPIAGVTWFGARTYCEVMGKALPTEAQWEAAARGPQGETYPWGNEPATCANSVIKDGRGRSCGVEKRGTEGWKGRPFIVGARDPGRYGLYDMAGNNWEYVADWMSTDYAECGEACLGVNPTGPCDGDDACEGHGEKIVKGGSWYWSASKAVGYYRRPQPPNNRPFHHFGFRCAASVEQATALDGKPLPDNAPIQGMSNADAKRR